MVFLTVTRVICTGSRDLDDEAGRLLVDRTLDALYAECKAHLHILVGDCPTGADYWVRNWATWRRRQGWSVEFEEFAAHWRTTFPRRKAGPDRNARMVKAGADRGAAFYAPPPALNRGTDGCAQLATDVGIPVYEYGWGKDGSVRAANQATADYEQGILPI